MQEGYAKFPIQEGFLGAEFSGIARAMSTNAIQISFHFQHLFGLADPFLAVLCSLYPKEVVDDLVTRHMANPKQA